MPIKAYALDPATTVITEGTDENGNWINPLVMMTGLDQTGKSKRQYTVLYPEAEDPFLVPALKDHAILGEYTPNEDLEKQYFEMVKRIKFEIARESAGLVIAPPSALGALNRKKGGH